LRFHNHAFALVLLVPDNVSCLDGIILSMPRTKYLAYRSLSYGRV